MPVKGCGERGKHLNGRGYVPPFACAVTCAHARPRSRNDQEDAVVEPHCEADAIRPRPSESLESQYGSHVAANGTGFPLPVRTGA